MPTSPISARERVLVVALLALHAVLAWLTRRPGVLTAQDPALYLMLGEQLRHFSYRSTYLVGAPAHIFYPPGYPALLALWGMFGGGFDWGVVLSIICSAVGLTFVYLAVRERWGGLLALLGLGALALNPAIIRQAGAVASEGPYLALSMATLWAVGRPTTRPRGWGLVTGILAGLVRAAGATLLLAVAITWLRARRFRLLAILALAGTATVGAWNIFTMVSPQQYVNMSYAADFQQVGASSPHAASLPRRLAHRVERNTVFHVTRTIPGSLPFPAIPGTPIDNVVGILIWGTATLVGLVAFARGWFVATIYLTCYAALIAVWPWQSDRFLEPVVPLLVVLMLVGWHRMALRALPRAAPLATAALGGLLIATASVRDVGKLRWASACQRGQFPPHASCVAPEQASYFAALSSMRLPDDAVVLSSSPPVVYYYSGAKGIAPPLEALPDSARFIPFLEDFGVSHILLSSVHRSDITVLAPRLRSYCSVLRVEESVPPFTYLFSLDDGVANQDACRAIRLFFRANRHQRFDFRW